MQRMIVIAGLCWLAACGEDDRGRRGACAVDQLEADLDATPFTGAGVDPETQRPRLTAGKTYVVSSTYGVPIPGPNGAPITEKYGQLFAGIQSALTTQPGLVAFQVASSSACASGRTLAIWESEQQMYEFVLGPAHFAAVRAVDEILEPGFTTTHWSASAPEEMTFAAALKHLADTAPAN